MSQLDKDHLWVVTHAPSHWLREGTTQSVPNRPTNGRDRQLKVKPPEQLAGHPPVGGHTHVPTPKMQGNDHIPPTDRRAPPHSKQGGMKLTTPLKGATIAPASPLV